MRIVDTKQYLDALCDLLRQGKTGLSVPVAGISMGPFLHEEDVVYLDLPTRPLRKGDIVLFTRPEGRYILHRIVKCCPDGSYLILGDNQTIPESVPAERIRAIVTSALRKGKPITPKSPIWWFFAHPWRWLAPARRIIGKIHSKLK